MHDQVGDEPQWPGWFMSPFGGLDRLFFDPDPGFKQGNPRPLKKDWDKREVRVAWMRKWLQHLFENSNFYFTGTYLNGKGDAALLTSASRTGHNWTESFSRIEQQGWGIWPIYQGFAVSPRQTFVMIPPEPDWTRTRVQRGIAAGNHIKDIVSHRIGGNAGMVVYIDNEEGEVATLVPYYRALFNELQTDRGDGRPAMRAGLYIRVGFVNQLLDQFPDLFIWLVESLTLAGDEPVIKDGDPWPLPIESAKGKSGYQRFLNERYPIVLEGMRFVGVGRQCTLYSSETRKDGYTHSMIAGEGQGVKGSIDGWDFNVSFVRDPRYPQADPRFVYQEKIIYSTYDKKGVRTKEVGSRHLALQGIEPEAPLVSLGHELYSIDTNGSVVMTTKCAKKLSWEPSAKHSPWDPPVTVVPKGGLRSMRALTVIKIPLKEALLLYISNQNQVQVYRRVHRNAWEANQPGKWEVSGTWDVGTLHPFTNMCVVLFKAKAWLFFMQAIPKEATEATLTVAEWQGSTQQLGKGLKGTAIAAIATNNYLFVFIIGKDRQLYFAYAYGDDKALRWSALKEAGSPYAKILCHPHSRIAACIIGPTHVKAVVMSFDGIPSAYDFTFADAGAKSSWGSSACKQYPVKDTDKGGDSPQGFVVAKQWTVNPYGDILLVQNGSRTELYCAACAPNKRGILLRHLDKSDEPWFRLDDEASDATP